MKEQREREVSFETVIAARDEERTLLDAIEDQATYDAIQQEFAFDDDLYAAENDALEDAINDPAVLTAAERAVMWLRFEGELESSEIAQVLGRTMRSIEALTLSATRKLKARLVAQAAALAGCGAIVRTRQSNPSPREDSRIQDSADSNVRPQGN